MTRMQNRRRLGWGIGSAALALVALGARTLWSVPIAWAATITVTTTIDENNADGDCSLREAVIAANENRVVDACAAGNNTGTDTITVPAGSYLFLVAGTSENYAETGDLDINDDVLIVGAGRSATIIHANGLDRAFSLENGGAHALTLKDLTLSGGTGVGSAVYVGSGALNLDNVRLTAAVGNGAVVYMTGDTLTITDSRIDDNPGVGVFINGTDPIADIRNTVVSENHSSNDGGGIVSAGTLRMVNVTISGNDARLNGGGMRVSGPTELYNVSIIDNVADSDANDSGDGGGLSVDVGATLLIANSLIANNSDASVTTQIADCMGTLNSLGHNLVEDATGCTISGFSSNLVGVDPITGALANNGGQTWTHALLAGSPAINAGDPQGCLDGDGALIGVDQRGFARADRCDVGAYEANSPGTPTPSATPTATATATITPTPTATLTPTAGPSPTPTVPFVPTTPAQIYSLWMPEIDRGELILPGNT